MQAPKIEYFGTISTTFALADRAIARGERDIWLVAACQTEGRGRYGRHWQSPKGNFYASYLWQTSLPTKYRAALSFVGALALWDRVDQLGPNAPLTLKWPNDLLLGGEKLAGILVENRKDHVIFGIGVNLASFPPADQPRMTNLAATSLMAHGISIEPKEFAPKLAEYMSQRLAQFTDKGFQSIRDDWIARAAHLGKTITVRLPDRELTGRFATLDESGALILETLRGREVVTAGEVYFG